MAGLVATTKTSTRFTRFSRQGALLRFYYLYAMFIFFTATELHFFCFVLGLVGCLERLRGGGGAGCVRARKVFGQSGNHLLAFPICIMSWAANDSAGLPKTGWHAFRFNGHAEETSNAF